MIRSCFTGKAPVGREEILRLQEADWATMDISNNNGTPQLPYGYLPFFS